MPQWSLPLAIPYSIDVQAGFLPKPITIWIVGDISHAHVVLYRGLFPATFPPRDRGLRHAETRGKFDLLQAEFLS